MTGIHYIKVMPEASQWKMAPSNQSNNSLFDGLMHHYYMEKLAFCALIKHMFKTDLQKDEISCTK